MQSSLLGTYTADIFQPKKCGAKYIAANERNSLKSGHILTTAVVELTTKLVSQAVLPNTQASDLADISRVRTSYYNWTRGAVRDCTRLEMPLIVHDGGSTAMLAHFRQCSTTMPQAAPLRQDTHSVPYSWMASQITTWNPELSNNGRLWDGSFLANGHSDVHTPSPPCLH